MEDYLAPSGFKILLHEIAQETIPCRTGILIISIRHAYAVFNVVVIVWHDNQKKKKYFIHKK